MSFYNLLRDSLEEFDQDEFTPEAGEAVVEEIINEADSPAGMASEILNKGEVDVMEETVSMVSDNVDAMESLAESLESHIKQGNGLTPLSNHLLNSHLNSISKRLGVKFVTHSIETLADDADALQAAQDSLESIKDKLKQAYDWIIKKLREIWTMAKEWFENTTIMRRRYRNRAEALLKTVKAIPNDDPRTNPSGKVEGLNLHWLHKDSIGGLYSAEQLGIAINNVADITKIISTSELRKVRRALFFVTKGKVDEWEAANDAYERDTGKLYTKQWHQENPEGGKVQHTSYSHFIWRPITNHTDQPDVLSKSEMEGLLNDILNSLKKADSSQSKLNKELDTKEDEAELDKVRKEAEKTNDDRTMAELRAAQLDYLKKRRSMNKFAREATRAHIGGMKVGLEWVAKSLSYKPQSD